MKHQLTKEITEEFERRSHVVFNCQDRQFNKTMKHKDRLITITKDSDGNVQQVSCGLSDK